MINEIIRICRMLKMQNYCFTLDEQVVDFFKKRDFKITHNQLYYIIERN